MKNQRTHALGVPLRRPGKFRRQVRIDRITHAYNNGYVKTQTLCGILYTHKEHLVRNRTMLARRTSRDVDCMTCLVLL
jgi:hypothetical protein